MLENQQKQTELLRQGLVAALKEQRSVNVSNFRWLQPVIFLGEERSLDFE